MLKFLTTVSLVIILMFGYVTGTHNVLAYEAEKAISAHYQPITLKMATEISPVIAKTASRMHIVKKGDWLSKIATRYDTTVPMIVEANKEAYPSLATNPDLIKNGWKLVIPTTTKSSPESVAQAKQSDYPETTVQAAPRDKHISSPPHQTKKPRAKSKKHLSGASSQKTSSRGITLRLERNLALINRIIDEYHPIIVDEQRRNPVPSDKILGMIWVESKGNPEAIGSIGERGAMQLAPKTRVELGLSKHDAFRPDKNVRAGMRYLRGLYERLGRDEDVAIAAYNRGEQGVRDFMDKGGDPSQLEYVRNVKAAAKLFKEQLRRRT